MKTAWVIAFTIVFSLLASGIVALASRQPRGAPVTLLPPPTPAPLVVDVSGAVVRPGVIHLPRGSRVQDALQAAGGFLADADDQALNLAAWVQDGELIRVPYQPQAVSGPSTTTRSGELPVTAPAASTGLVNINTATLEELDTLPGIGPAIAQRIIDYRSANGPFAAIEDIQDVSGIGPATFARLQDLISVTMD